MNMFHAEVVVPRIVDRHGHELQAAARFELDLEAPDGPAAHARLAKAFPSACSVALFHTSELAAAAAARRSAKEAVQ